MKDISDEEILEYLINSDFNDIDKIEQFKFLLFKFKYFYRILHGNLERIKGEKDVKISQLENKIKSLENKINLEMIKSSNLKNKIDTSNKERRLTWKERFNGKIKKW
jgi:hypothetical protein